MNKRLRNRLIIAAVFAAVALASWLTPYDYAGCSAISAPGIRCVFRNSGLTIVRTLSVGVLILVLITPSKKG